MGRPRIAHDRLDTLEFSRVALMPHFSRRGPNGIWELRRGVNHPFEARLRNTAAYIHVLPDGLPSRICCMSRLGTECQIIQVFASSDQARQNAQEQEDLELPELRVMRIEGTTLLDALSYADVVEVFARDGTSTELCLTHMGTVTLQDDQDQSTRLEPAEAVLDALVNIYGVTGTHS